MTMQFLRLSIRGLPAALAIFATAPCVLAQNFNLDYGDDAGGGQFGKPTNAYAAGGGQAGFWEALEDGAPGVNIPPSTSVPWYVKNNLIDTAGNVTGVSTSAVISSASNGLGDFEFDNGSTFGDDQALMDDTADIGNAFNLPQLDVTFTGLLPGAYEVYTYSWAPDSSEFRTTITVNGSTSPAQTCGGAWPGGLQLGVTHTLHVVQLCAGDLTVTGVSVPAPGGGLSFGSINGIQLKRTGDPTCGGLGTPFCFGNATCPCGPGNPNAGCQNENGGSPTGGAVISATSSSGAPSVTTDSAATQVTLNLTDAAFLKTTIFFEGAGSTAPVPFGDGLLCINAVIRLNGAAPAGDLTDAVGALAYPNANHTLSICQRYTQATTGVHPTGSFHYQAAYRDPAPDVCGGGGGTINTSSALTLVWGP